MRWLVRRLARFLDAEGLGGLGRTVPEDRPIVTYVGNNRVLVGTKVGAHTITYYVEADDRLLAPHFIATGKFETAITNYLLRSLRPDSRCIDAGSNFGYYTCMMARHCPEGRVLGVEPERRIAELARDNLFINGLYETADVVCAAVSGDSEGLTLYRRTSRSGNTSIVAVDEALTTRLGEPTAQPFSVPSVRIDDLAQQFQGRVDFIKIDVEGAEPLALRGARQTILRNRDIAILMEWSPGQIAAAGFHVQDFVDDIARLGLRCFSLDLHGERPVPDGGLSTMPYQAAILLRRADAPTLAIDRGRHASDGGRIPVQTRAGA